MRQEDLARQWHFTCTCARCEDPSEAGSFFSSLRCAVGGCAGFAIKQEDQTWKCSFCEKDLTAQMASREAMVENLGMQLEDTNSIENICQVVDLVDKVAGVHANHWLSLRANIRFCDLITSNPKLLAEEAIARQVAERSQAALTTLSLVDPGLSKLSGR